MKVGRNEPCPCGSGKKHKKCCLGKVAVASPAAAPAPSARQLKAKTKHPLPHVSAYSLVKLTENADLSQFDPALARRVRELAQAAWSRAKLAAMSTDEIEKQLRDYGVNFSREGFLEASQGQFSAWQLSEAWFAQGNLSCRGMDEDFLGLAACELWKRLLPERPSMEMVDDWLEAGYAFSDADSCQACEHWWPAWRGLQPHLSPAMRSLSDADKFFQGSHLIFNWTQDFEFCLDNAALYERRYAHWGEQYCREWLAQFSKERPEMQVNFRRKWAEFTFAIGQVEPARVILEQTLEAFPKNPWSYVALADAYSHLFADREFHLAFDLEKAREYLELGLARLRGKPDRSVLEERLEGLSELVAVTDKPPRPMPPSRGSLTVRWP